MKYKTMLILFSCLFCLSSLAQRQMDLTKFAKLASVAAGPKYDIDTLSKILCKKFIAIANDDKTDTHKNIQDFFDGYRTNDENMQYNVYPKIIQAKHLSIQFLDYSYNYGWAGTGVDSAFNSSTLTALVLIPAFDNFQKGNAVNTLCFKVTLKVYTEGNLHTNKDYKREEKITDLKLMDFDN